MPTPCSTLHLDDVFNVIPQVSKATKNIYGGNSALLQNRTTPTNWAAGSLR